MYHVLRPELFSPAIAVTALIGNRLVAHYGSTGNVAAVLPIRLPHQTQLLCRTVIPVWVVWTNEPAIYRNHKQPSPLLRR